MILDLDACANYYFFCFVFGRDKAVQKDQQVLFFLKKKKLNSGYHCQTK